MITNLFPQPASMKTHAWGFILHFWVAQNRVSLFTGIMLGILTLLMNTLDLYLCFSGVYTVNRRQGQKVTSRADSTSLNNSKYICI